MSAAVARLSTRARLVSVVCILLVALLAPGLAQALGTAAGRDSACVIPPDRDHNWEVVLAMAADARDAAHTNTVTYQLVRMGANQYGAEPELRCRRYEAEVSFPTRAEATRFLRRLLSAGYVRKYHVQPLLERS